MVQGGFSTEPESSPSEKGLRTLLLTLPVDMQLPVDTTMPSTPGTWAAEEKRRKGTEFKATLNRKQISAESFHSACTERGPLATSNGCATLCGRHAPHILCTRHTCSSYGCTEYQRNMLIQGEEPTEPESSPQEKGLRTILSPLPVAALTPWNLTCPLH